MASPQKENGHTGISNEILEQIMTSKFNGSQFRILICIFRQTYGFQRKEHRMSVSFIAQATEMTPRQVQRELSALIRQNVITIVKETDNHNSRVISFNKNYEKWASGDGLDSTDELVTTDRIDTTSSDGIVTPSSVGLVTQINKKETLKEIITFWLSKKLVQHKTVTPQMEQQINWKLNAGYTKNQLIESISNYDSILNDPDYLLQQKWGMDVFFMSHFQKFLSESDPFNYYPKKKSSTSISSSSSKHSNKIPFYFDRDERNYEPLLEELK